MQTGILAGPSCRATVGRPQRALAAKKGAADGRLRGVVGEAARRPKAQVPVRW